MTKTGQASLNRSGGFDQHLQAHKSFSGGFDAACQPNELEPSLHNVVGTPVAGNNMCRLSSPHDLALSTPGELVESRFEGALLYLLARMGL
jgi:hypothetical protein